MTSESILFDSCEEAEDLIVICNACHRPRKFFVKEVSNGFVLERFSSQDIRKCDCPVPSVTNEFDHKDLVSAVSTYL